MIDFNAPPIKNVLPILLGDLKIDDLANVKPRALKSAEEKISRTRKIAEVFTPSRVVKFMVDALDNEEFYWQTYIESRWLEIACGEAPFITNRYDAETGELIPFLDRAGILDRKLRRIPDNVDKSTWAFHAVESVYGYELQPDSLLIARANVLLTFAEFVKNSSDDELAGVAKVIAHNFWQMDGLNPPDAQIKLVDDYEVRIFNWRTGEEYFFGGINMGKFDFVIGNPPYQDETKGDNKTFAPPVYDKLMEEAHKVGEKVELITPARFLFDAGATPKDFNKRMLNDEHLKVLDYTPDARKCFKGVDIKGGVAITLHDETKNFGAIGTFTPFPELNSIHKKVCVDNPDFRPLNKIMYSRTAYSLTPKAHEDFPDAIKNFSKGNQYQMSSNVFDLMPEIFFDDKPNDGHEYIQLYGRKNSERVFKWVRRDYVTYHESLEKFKVFVPDSNGSGALGEVVSTPLVGTPLVGSTQTFITVGAFATRAEADACIAYIKSRFCRVMLGILKVTQHNPPQTWAKVPLQDFTSASDIDWSGDVDAQLYRKYGLDDAEIKFIETHVKEMQ